MSWAPGQAIRRSKVAWKITVPAPFEVIHPVDLNLVSETLGLCRGPSRDTKEAGEGEAEQLDFLPFPTAKQESLLLTASSVLGKLQLSGSWFSPVNWAQRGPGHCASMHGRFRRVAGTVRAQ